MLAGRTGEIVSRRETPSQCGRVGSPVFGKPHSETICLEMHSAETQAQGWPVVRAYEQWFTTNYFFILHTL